MDGALLSRYPHASWLGFSFNVAPSMGNVCWNLKGTTHSLNVVFRGHGCVRWLCRGRETRYDATPCSMHFLPSDGESHTLLATASEETSAYTLFVPQGHLDSLADEDHLPAHAEYHRLFLASDPVLYSCMLRLASPVPALDHHGGVDTEESARRLVMRLVKLSGGGTPDWHDDASVFDRRTLGHLVGYIDAHLKIAPSLGDMAIRVGLSPSHFAKKFRASTGLSLHRFVNRRRTLTSLELLKNPSETVAHCSLTLGFSSQAHFTHHFSRLTGITPAKYRKQFRRVVG